MKKLLFSLIAILFAINAYAQPSTISYQGVLTDAGGAVLDGNYTIRFDICTGLNGANSVWNETHNIVSVNNGLFQVELGSVTPFGTLNFSTPYWLEITVDPSGTNTTLSPRIAFNASGYSLAGKATSLQIATGAGAGKVLTSDAQGNGSWQDASGGSFPSIISDNLINNTVTTGSYTTLQTITVPSMGKYLITVFVDYTTNNIPINTRVKQNATILTASTNVSWTANPTYVSISHVINLTTTDNIIIEGKLEDAGTINAVGNAVLTKLSN